MNLATARLKALEREHEEYIKLRSEQRRLDIEFRMNARKEDLQFREQERAQAARLRARDRRRQYVQAIFEFADRALGRARDDMKDARAFGDQDAVDEAALELKQAKLAFDEALEQHLLHIDSWEEALNEDFRLSEQQREEAARLWARNERRRDARAELEIAERAMERSRHDFRDARASGDQDAVDEAVLKLKQRRLAYEQALANLQAAQSVEVIDS